MMVGESIMTESSLRKEFGPAGSKVVLHVMAGAFCALLGHGTLAIGDAEGGELFVGYLLLFMGLLVIVMRINDALRGQPKLILTASGLDYQATRQSQFHRWHDVGVFALKTKRLKYNKFRYVCAYSDVNHDALHENEDGTSVGLYNADVSLEITDMEMGRSDETAEQLVLVLNAWRNKYGSPEHNAYHLTHDQVEALRKKKTWKNRLTIIGIIVFTLAVAFASEHYS